jgi:hypothetical protein
MKEIKLTQGKVAIVDDDDYERLSQFKWHARKREKTYYAMRSLPIGNGKYLRVRMHRDILNVSEDTQIDHIDRNGLNNQKSNLRPCDHAENQWNTDAPITNTSGVKGVSWDKTNRKWLVQLHCRNKKIHLGRHPDKEEAVKIYDNAAKEHFGEFARPNYG